MKTSCIAAATLCLFGLCLTMAARAETAQEAANKQLVLDYYKAIEAATANGISIEQLKKADEQYRSSDYIQHSVNGAGPAERKPGSPSPKMGPPKLLAIMAEGDQVIQVTSRTMSDASGQQRETVIFNLFRVKNGKLVEHWDAFGVPAAQAPK